MYGDKGMFVIKVVDRVAARQSDPRGITDVIAGRKGSVVRLINVTRLKAESPRHQNGAESGDAYSQRIRDYEALIHGSCVR